MKKKKEKRYFILPPVVFNFYSQYTYMYIYTSYINTSPRYNKWLNEQLNWYRKMDNGSLVYQDHFSFILYVPFVLAERTEFHEISVGISFAWIEQSGHRIKYVSVTGYRP